MPHYLVLKNPCSVGTLRRSCCLAATSIDAEETRGSHGGKHQMHGLHEVKRRLKTPSRWFP
jgi:hypothetical protein